MYVWSLEFGVWSLEFGVWMLLDKQLDKRLDKRISGYYPQLVIQTLIQIWSLEKPAPIHYPKFG